MRIRLIGAIAALAVALGALAFPSAGPAQAGSTKCTGWTSTLVPPTSIRVYRTATKRTQTVRFRTYVEKVMASEWGAAAPAAALRVGAVAAKQFGWYYAIVWRGGRDAAGRCYDVRDSSVDQLYNPSRSTVASHAAAVAATWRISLRKGERFFLTGYRPGTGSCTANLDGWHLFQRDAMDCVRRYGDLAERLARRFFSSVSWITPGTGDYTGDGRGDLAILAVAPDTGQATATVYTTDTVYKAAVAAGSLRGVALTEVPLDQVLGRAAGDVDGDGRMDLVQLVAAAAGVALEVMQGSGSGFLPAARWWTDAADPEDLSGGSYRLLVTDFTGDGRADAAVVRIRAGETPDTSLYLAASSGTAFGAVKQTWTTTADLTTSAFRAGDMNGDGLGDLVILAPREISGTFLQVALGTRTQALRAPSTWATDPLSLDAIQVLVADPNRDGRDDLVVVRRTGEDGITMVVYRGATTGTSFSRAYFSGALPVSFAGTRFSAADTTGDGRSDLFALVNRGADADGNSLGTSVVRFYSTGTTFTRNAWFSIATLPWETAFPY